MLGMEPDVLLTIMVGGTIGDGVSFSTPLPIGRRGNNTFQDEGSYQGSQELLDLYPCYKEMELSLSRRI